MILLPEIQEVNDLPSDTGSPRAVLEKHKDFAGVAGLDFSAIDESEERHGVAWTSKQGFFHPDNIAERAKWVRRWLRDREEQEIVGEWQSDRRNETRKANSLLQQQSSLMEMFSSVSPMASLEFRST